jgi:hypothetical protein
MNIPINITGCRTRIDVHHKPFDNSSTEIAFQVFEMGMFGGIDMDFIRSNNWIWNKNMIEG